jgi:predicted O-methyltransferase YrrM
VATPERFYLTPRYICNRVRDLLYQRTHPTDPWLTPAAIGMLSTLLHPADRGAEFGSGRSTLWFAARVAALTSVETNTQGHEKVTNQLKERGVSLDFALMDGYYRDYAAKFIMPKVKPGGILILDNINWHLPSQSKAPGTRTAELGPATSTWAEIGQELAGWRRIWTSNGVWDTAIFFKPVG